MRKAYTLIPLLCAMTAFVVPAFADPETTDECLAAAFDVTEKASREKLSEAETKLVQQLIARLEGECSAEKLSEAGNTILEIKKVLQ